MFFFIIFCTCSFQRKWHFRRSRCLLIPPWVSSCLHCVVEGGPEEKCGLDVWLKANHCVDHWCDFKYQVSRLYGFYVVWYLHTSSGPPGFLSVKIMTLKIPNAFGQNYISDAKSQLTLWKQRSFQHCFSSRIFILKTKTSAVQTSWKGHVMLFFSPNYSVPFVIGPGLERRPVSRETSTRCPPQTGQMNSVLSK